MKYQQIHRITANTANGPILTVEVIHDKESHMWQITLTASDWIGCTSYATKTKQAALDEGKRMMEQALQNRAS